MLQSLKFWPLLLPVLLLTTSCQIDFVQLRQRILNQSADREAADDPSQSPHIQFVQAATPPDSALGDLTAATQATATPAAQAQTTSLLPPVDPLRTHGDLTIAGSPELDALNALMYQNFVRRGYADAIALNSIGSTAAIQLFCNREPIDLLTVTRTMTDAEVKACNARGIQPIRFAIGKDALVLVVNPNDTFVKNVNLERLEKILTLEKWSAIDPSWPNQPIERFLVGPDSAFVNLLADKVFKGDKQAIVQRSNTNFYKYEEPIIQALSSSQYGVGILSYPAYQRSQKSLRAVAVNRAIANPETAGSGAYPLERTLFIYVDSSHLRSTPAVNTFVNFYLTHIEKEIEQVGLFPLNPNALKESETQWLKIVKPTMLMNAKNSP